MLEKLRDAIRELVQKLTGKAKKQAQTAERMLQEAFEAASRRAAENSKNAANEGGEAKYSISPKFYNIFDEWDGKTTGFSFVMGDTSDALVSAGLPKKQIRIDASKVAALLEKHSGMTVDTVRQIPALLENPVIVIDSKKSNDAKIVMGDLRDANGKTVTVVLLLTPTSKKGNTLDIIKVSSAQGRDHIKSLFYYDNGTPVSVRYVDKKRIQDWLNANRLQLPLRNLSLDSNLSLSQNAGDVKGKFSLKKYSEEEMVQHEKDAISHFGQDLPLG